MKPEHFKEFSLVDAKAGAPYCQRNGLAARIGIWDMLNETYPLLGCRKTASGETSCSWGVSGRNDVHHRTEFDLIMLPLGMCEGKPVFVGDALREFGDAEIFKVTASARLFNGCKWPHTAPVMPRWFDNEYDNDVMVRAMVIRPAIEAYWKALDEFNGVKDE